MRATLKQVAKDTDLSIATVSRALRRKKRRYSVNEEKIYAAAQSNVTLISAGDYADNTASRVYIKNTGSSSTDYFTLELGASNIVLGRLYGQDIAWLPYEGEQDIDISSTGTNMELEFMVINEG